MASLRFTDNEIRVRIVPKHLRWPARGSSIAWTKGHDCVDALQDLVRGLDIACVALEQNRDISAVTIARRRAELCEQALRRLQSFKAFEIAEKELTADIVALESLSARDPQQVLMLQKLTQALHDLREGIEATRPMVLDRCKMRERVLSV